VLYYKSRLLIIKNNVILHMSKIKDLVEEEKFHDNVKLDAQYQEEQFLKDREGAVHPSVVEIPS